MEKGGKGFSLPTKGLKSSLKSTAKGTLKGKDDNPAKLGRKVQFNSEGKRDKGDKVSNDGKAKESPLELKIEQELPKNAKCMMDCEAAQILQGIQEQMVLLSRDPTIKLPVSFDRGLQYAKTGARYTSPQSVRRVLESLKDHCVSDGESKKNMLKEPLEDVLSELVKLKQQA
ncbi:DNA-directed RNA polymerases IV and V subunit 4 isoform X2 [Jatropha curcas]|uniref:DNA-directed RNA polymerases IV and V subunit 4 isoform X2 n=1 Tax=Jatropha curcas TaxID=180498 RepID=UPI00189524CA|nr:DNA-directed RNA polymerases IV and V subunit 4 isoform X2 [Jatropha curcas]